MIKRFLLLNGLATIGVVLNHAAGQGYTVLWFWTGAGWADLPVFEQVGSLPYYSLRTIEQLIAFSIAAFLVVSGFFIAFAARRQSAVSWGTVKTRIWYLVIPYLLWSLAVFVSDFFLYDKVLTGEQYGYRLLTGRATSGYYYVPMVCQMYLLAPLLVRLAKRNWRLLLGITAVVQLIIQAAWYADTLGTTMPKWVMFWTQSWLFPYNLFWFALGIIIGFNLSAFKEWVGQMKTWWLVTAVGLIPIGIIEREIIQTLSGQPILDNWLTLIDSLYAIAVIFAFLAYENVAVPRAHQISDLGTKSYGVYLANSPVLALTASVVAKVIPGLLAYQILFQPLLWVAGLGIPLILMALVSSNKSPARAYYQYIFG